MYTNIYNQYFYTTDNKNSWDQRFKKRFYTTKLKHHKRVVLFNYSEPPTTKPICSINHEAKIKQAFVPPLHGISSVLTMLLPHLLLDRRTTQDTHPPPVTIIGTGHTRQGPAHDNRSEGSLGALCGKTTSNKELDTIIGAQATTLYQHPPQCLKEYYKYKLYLQQNYIFKPCKWCDTILCSHILRFFFILWIVHWFKGMI